MTDQDPPQPQCPDGGDCLHRCLSGCWRVLHESPWPGVYDLDVWPTNVRRAMGALVQDGTPAPAPSDFYWGSQQGRILAFLHRYLAEHGYPPSIREVGAAVGLSSSSVAHQLNVLEQRGHIKRAPGSPRAITLLTPPPPTEET